VLFRVHGKDAGTLYNLDRELEIVKMLSAYEIGPAVFGNGDGWRIEEWHFSVPLPNRRMRNPAIFAQVASHMGRMHKLSSRTDFPPDIAASEPLSLERMVKWGEGCRVAAQGFTDPNAKKQIEAFNVDEVLEEREWITRFAVADDPRIHGSGLDVVFCHWDSQENNILQTQYGLRFIDYEYAGMEYQAFDIATYFAECTMDYLVNTHPFYKVSLADFPMESEQRLFCSIYLSEYLETDVYPDDLSVSVLLERVRRFVLVVHYLWSLWSVIRAPQAPTYADFDYLGYAQHRWFMYKWAKRELLHSKGAA
jgi:thiamine kinase-like enzyme